MKLFKILAGEALEALSLDELTEYRAALRDVAEKIYAKDADTIGDFKPSDLHEQMTAGVAAIEAATDRITELSKDETDEGELDSEIEALAVRARGAEAAAETEPEAAEEPAEEAVAAAAEEAETEAEVEPEATEEADEAVTAAAEKTEEPAPTRPARSRAAKPVDRPAEKRPTLTASCEGLPGFAIGEEFPDELALAAAMLSKRERFGHMTAREDVPVARLDWRDSYPEDRRLSPADGVEAATAKVNSLLASIQSDPKRGTDESLVASGGICAPVTPYYDLQMISVAERPVRGMLPAFLADRGGIRFGTPPTLADVDTAVGIITAAEDGLGGTSATKTCQVLECPDFSEVDIDILYHCVQTSNLTYRTFPEQLAQFNQLVLAAHARMAETKLLDGMKTASTAVTAASIGLGAVGDLLGQVLAAASAMRSRHRMNPDSVLRLVMPRWATALMVSDVIRSQFERFDTDEGKITALLRTFNVEPSFHIDGTTGGAQIFGTQTPGGLLEFPSHVEWMLYPEGSFLYLDGGTLELGLVRDSVLNSTNEFQIFGETFENVAFLGIESLHITSATADTGTVSAPHATSGVSY